MCPWLYVFNHRLATALIITGDFVAQDATCHVTGIDLLAKFADSCFYFTVAVVQGYLFPIPLGMTTSIDLSCLMLLFSCHNTGHFIMKNYNLVLNSESLLQALCIQCHLWNIIASVTRDVAPQLNEFMNVSSNPKSWAKRYYSYRPPSHGIPYPHPLKTNLHN